MKGTVFSIEEFSVYDGPGIRTTVFLKGCPLRCTWCHNPEGQRFEKEIVRSPNGCIECNMCIRTSVNTNGHLAFTEESIKKCPMNLLRYSGEVFESNMLCERLLKNARILNNGGGITFSGGEPLSQSDFLFECLDTLEGKLHRAIQTCGFCNEDIFSRALLKADYFLYDLKLADCALHKKYTGVENGLIIANFEKLVKSGKDFVVRTPLIPGVTDTEENIKGIADILKSNGVNYIELLPYNKFAGGKYKMLLREFKPGYDETQDVVIRENIFNDIGIKTKIM